MSANAPHGTTSEYSTCGAEAISRITVVKLSIGNHVIVVIVFGEPFYHAVAIIKPYGVSSKVVAIPIIIVLVCWK